VEPEEKSIVIQLLGKTYFQRQRPTMELLLRDVVFCGSALRLYNDDFRKPRGWLREFSELAVGRIIGKRWQERN
jgi:hypothetical protein